MRPLQLRLEVVLGQDLPKSRRQMRQGKNILRLPRLEGGPVIFWFRFILSHKQRLRLLGYCAPLKVKIFAGSGASGGNSCHIGRLYPRQSIAYSPHPRFFFDIIYVISIFAISKSDLSLADQLLRTILIYHGWCCRGPQPCRCSAWPARVKPGTAKQELFFKKSETFYFKSLPACFQIRLKTTLMSLFVGCWNNLTHFEYLLDTDIKYLSGLDMNLLPSSTEIES